MNYDVASRLRLREAYPENGEINFKGARHHDPNDCYPTTFDQATDNTAIRPFHVNVPETELTELRRRINATKLPERETVTDATQGVQLATIRRWRAIGRPSMTGARSRQN